MDPLSRKSALAAVQSTGVNQEAGKSGSTSDPNDEEIETFDSPAGTKLSSSGLFLTFTDFGVLSIDHPGRVMGSFHDASGVAHGFIREVDGQMTTIDIPGASQGTFPAAINDLGVITGSYLDASGFAHGFVLRGKWDGSYDSAHAITIDYPQAPVSAPIPGTYPAAINDEGEIAGVYYDENGVIHSLTLSPNRFGMYDAKNFVTFDAPGAAVGFFEGTSAWALNRFGALAGTFQDSAGAAHPFVRDARGTFTEFDVPGSPGLYPYSSVAIDNEGRTAGTYFEPISGNPFGGNYRGFIRGKHGDFETFDAATYSPCCIFTFATSINSSGQTTGFDNDGYSVFHGFMRDRDGTISTFDAPSAGTGFNQGTQALVINDSGVVAGIYSDANYVVHGFVRHAKPLHCH